MRQYVEKNIDGGTLDVDTSSRKVKVAINKVGVLDLDGDVIDKTAFNRTIKQRGPSGSNMIWHLTDHKASLKDAVGKFKELYMENDYLVGVTDIPATTWGNDMLEFYKTGHINQHSVGFRTLKSEPVDAGKATEHNLIKEVLLYEGSAVLWGANPETPTLGLVKSMTKEEAGQEYLQTLEEFNSLAKLFKTGHLSDQSFELIELRMTQLTDKLKQLFEKATQPAEKALDPVKESLLDVFKTFNQSLNYNESWNLHPTS